MDGMRAAIVSLIALAACSMQAAPYEPGESGAAESLTGPLSFQLSQTDGPLEVRLAGLETPEPDRTRDALAALVEGEIVQLAYAGARRDRYERALAQVYTGPEADPVWVQAELVSSGEARVLSHADNRAPIADLLRLEAVARREGRGLWAEPAHRVRDPHPDALAQDIGSVQLVEGRIIEATRLRSGRTYLNFGTDYRTDFTVMFDAEDEALFDAAGITAETLETRRVRVRGWIEDENGPMIRIDHPDRIELLDD